MTSYSKYICMISEGKTSTSFRALVHALHDHQIYGFRYINGLLCIIHVSGTASVACTFVVVDDSTMIYLQTRNTKISSLSSLDFMNPVLNSQFERFMHLSMKAWETCVFKPLHCWRMAYQVVWPRSAGLLVYCLEKCNVWTCSLEVMCWWL